MKFGLGVPFLCDPSAKDPCHQTYALCQIAERAGFDFISLGHHVFTPDYLTSAPFVILAASYVLGTLCWIGVDVRKTLAQADE